MNWKTNYENYSRLLRCQQKDIYQKSLLLLGIGIYNEVPGYLIDWWGYMSSSILQSAKITVNKTTIELGNW